MARRLRGTAATPLSVPPELQVFTAAEWEHPGDASSQFAAEWGAELARRVLTEGRWADARREWARQHGMNRFPAGMARSPFEREQHRRTTDEGGAR